MHFRVKKILGVTFGIFAMNSILSCGASNEITKDDGIIGSEIEGASALVSPTGESSHTFFALSDKTNQIHKFDLSTMKAVWSVENKSKSSEHGIVSSASGKYVVDLSVKSLVVYNSAGEVGRDPFTFQGTPISAAFNAESGFLVVYDNLQSVGILHLGENGRFEGNVLLGPLLGESKSIIAGDITNEGQLILSMSDMSLVVVDLAASIATKKWNYKQIATLEEIGRWVSPSVDGTNHTLVISDNTIYSVDYKTGIITTKIVLRKFIDRFIFKSKRGQSHVYANVGSIDYVFYLENDGSIKKTAVTYIAGKINKNVQSLLDLPSKQIMIFDGKNSILKMRTSDNLVVGQRDIPEGTKVILAPSYFVLFYNDAALGLLEKWHYETDRIESLAGYEMDYWKKR